MTFRARILVIEDRPPDRLYLTTLLRYRDYAVLEAANGEEGLAVSAAQRPDLVISDVLMPSMDGYQFVRRLRQTAAGADLPVIFYTGTYHEREARALAEECGVIEILIKPSDPDAILALVDKVLRRGRTRVEPIADGAFEQHHARLTADTLAGKARDLEESERRIAAIVEVGQRFIEERDPIALLNRVCATVREVTGAAYASTALFSEDLTKLTLVLTSGNEEATTASMRPGAELPDTVRRLTVDRRPLRARDSDGSRFMLVPLASRGRLYGCFEITGKAGGNEFSAIDELIAVTLGVQAGVAYENALLINELEGQAAALRAHRATTDFALMASRIGIFERDLITDEVTPSRSLEHVFPEAARARDMYELFHPDDRAAARSVVERAIQERTDFAFDARLVDGETGEGSVPHQVRGRVLINPHGVADRLVGVTVDMTERRRLEAQLRHAQKLEAVGQLAGGVAHDFNNLLTAILGYARFLVPTTLDQQQLSDVNEIIKAGERAVGLTRQLLAFSRRQSQDLTVFDLNALVRDLAQMLRRLIGEHVRLTTQLAPALSPIHADRGQMEQVIMNLAVNARDAMPSGGDLRIETANVDALDGRQQVRLTVSDTGVGMTEEIKARIFEPFFTTKEVGKGTGLGLATVFGIVTQTHGSLSVDTAPGKGASFSILLPRAQGALHAEAPVDAVELRGSESVLLVEDEEAVRLLARAMLERSGYRVTDAGTATDAMREARDRDLDLLITDVLMPGGTGPDLYRALSGSRPGLRVLYISGYAKDTVLDTRQLDAHAGFLAKPFSAESLARKVREILDR